MKSIKSFFQTTISRAGYPYAYLVIASLSVISRFKSKFQSTVTHFESPYNGQDILIVALYEKGKLRPDIVNMMIEAKKQNLYIIAINTLKVIQVKQLHKYIDCYIEKPNFGRDFGSYKTGFMHVFKNKLHLSCNRLIMLNDSIFYSKKGVDSMLKKLLISDYEVLGVTENYEIEYHLGSFCLSLSKNILNNKKFIKFWKKYKLTDIRPKVIKRGEMGLTKILKKVVSSEANIASIYDLQWIESVIKAANNRSEILTSLFNFTRHSDNVQWKKYTLKNVTENINNLYMLEKPKTANSQNVILDTNMAGISNKDSLQQDTNLFNLTKTIDGLVDYYLKNTTVENIDYFKEVIMENMYAEFMISFTSGSQIHNQAIILSRYGCPITKLDGIYRGVWDYLDVDKITNNFEDQEASDFKSFIYKRPYGEDNLIGWKNTAFMYGLI